MMSLSATTGAVQREDARKHGVPNHKLVSWIRRKIGGHIVIVRYKGDGTLGCAVPCVFCQRELIKYDIHIHCITTNGTWYSGRVDDINAPPAVFTTGQRRMLKLPPPPPPPPRQRKTHHNSNAHHRNKA
ncbi:hypothetical protein NADE_005584 [Nannochloris sp. 'desiccata']|nr:hypothetical protein NADE_005584 [Chlorella desiccata (nom. nud.)]